MAGHEWDDWFEREEFIGQISDIRVQNLQVEREVVQKRTFTRWMNLHLEKCNPPLEVRDLFRDIQDGRILMALLEELSGCKLLHGFKPSSHRIFRLNNIAKVLAFLEERNVKLVSIDAADVTDGNSSIVLGLIWNIILFFQIKELTGNIRSQFPSTSSLSSLPNSSDSDTSHSSTPSDERRPSIAVRDHGRPIKTLLHWVQRRTRKYGVAVQDFGKSWTSGLAFLAVIKSIDTTLVDMRRALLRTSKENLEDAFRTAHYSLGIPRLLEPEDVTINAPDEQSIMTYVSQFLEHFPGFDEEERSKPIERSMSLTKVSGRVNDTPVNGLHGKRERPYVVKKDWVQPPPKIFISSVSEDKEQPPSPLQTPGKEESFKSGHRKRPQDLGKEVSFTVSSSNSPQPSFVDSVIDSPDSWSDITSEAAPLEKLIESQSDGSLNENELPFDRRDSGSSDWPPEKPSHGEQESPAENGKVTEDQVFTDLFIDEGNFSESSVESIQTKSKIPSEEEEAYQYIMGLNEEERAEPSSPGNYDNPDQTNRLGSVSEQMEETSEEPERTDVLHEVDEDTSLTQNNIRESSPEADDDSLSKSDDRLEGALEHEDSSTSQNHDDKESSPDLFQEKHKSKILADTFCVEQEDRAGLKSILKQPPAEICEELEQAFQFEEQDHEDPSGLEKNQTHETPTLDNTCDPERTVLGSDQSSEMIVNGPDGNLKDENSGASDKLDETHDDRRNGNDGEHRDRGSRELDDTDETQSVTAIPPEPLCEPPHDIITPEVIETLSDGPPKTPAEEEEPSEPQNSPKESDGLGEECTEDHAYLSWTTGPDGGDGVNDAAEEADQTSSSTGPESGLAGLRDTDSVLQLQAAPDEGRALDSEPASEDCLAENREDSSQEKEQGRQEELDAGSQMPHSNEHVWDSGGAELDIPGKLCELIKTDEDPVVASENTETLRGKVANEVSTSESHFSQALHLTKDTDSDGLKIKSNKMSESGRSYKINSDLRGEGKPPVTCGVTTSEVYWLLFLWVALYCLFVLPQIDMKTLPHLLLNLEE
ncbi:hypothetical protein SKAU_G00334840 [Synaphobranchus kaupii]|uniref:Calmin n=1 Tax=Synaphobranchus kaupii TaxID=118154 RepID=A0A9Q1ELV5_SYNKA|nr:hypothetical protein SKAU_G00334840 [Synaphobranchus kaupii]